MTRPTRLSSTISNSRYSFGTFYLFLKYTKRALQRKFPLKLCAVLSY